MTRVPTLFALERSVQAMNDRRAALVDAQEQLSTGKRLRSPSDDPAGVAQAERFRARLARVQIERRMTDFAKDALGQADNLLGASVERIQYAREQLVAAGNATLGPQERAMLAQAIRSAREQLLALANQPDGSGGYVFGGQGGTGLPFSPAGAPAYQASPGERKTGLEAQFTTSLDGRAAFVDASGGRSVFEVLDDVTALLENATASGAELAAGLDSALSGVDTALERLLVQRTRVGEQLRALDARERLVESGELDATGQLSKLVDADYAAAISEFQKHQTALEAAMIAYSQIARLSLFDKL